MGHLASRLAPRCGVVVAALLVWAAPAAAELAALMETAHLLRSPRNAERLLAALARARSSEPPPESVEDLRREVGLG